MLVSNVGAGTVTEVEVGLRPTRSFIAGTNPHTVVVDDAARRAFVTNKGSSSISVIALTTGGVTRFAVGPNPHGLAVDEDYGRLYVTSTDADRLEVYDLSTLEQITTIPVGDGPWGVAVGPGRIAVTDTAADTVHLLDRDTLAVRDVVTGTNQVAVLDARRGTLIEAVPVANGPAGMAIDRRSGRVFVGNQAAGVVTTLPPARRR